MLMSLPELFPNHGPITSTPKKPSIHTSAVGTTTTNNNIAPIPNSDLLNGLQNGIHSKSLDTGGKWQARSCPVSPIGIQKPGLKSDCTSVKHDETQELIKDDDHLQGDLTISDDPIDANNSASVTTTTTTMQCNTTSCSASLINTKTTSSTTANQSAQHNQPHSASAFSSIPGYRTIQNRLENDPKSIRNRLLSALTDMIPHQETLSLRLLVNYTIDDGDSQCLVIDETLCRQNGTSVHSKSTGKRGPESMLLDSSDSGLVADASQLVPKRHKPDSTQSMSDTNVLDLSLHTEREDQELNDAMNTELDDPSDDGGVNESVEQSLLVDSLNCVMAQAHNESQSVLSGRTFLLPTPSVSGSIPAVMNSHNSVGNFGNTNGPTILSTASSLPFLDSTVLTLLPLLQQQQQQQQGLRFTTAPTKVPQTQISSTESTSTFIPGSSNTSETAEMLLLKELQALLSVQNNTCSSSAPSSLSYSIPSGNPIITNPNTLKPQAATTIFDMGINGITGNSATGLNSSATMSTVSGTPPFLGFPLFNPFGSENLTTVQTLLPTPNFTSFNLGSATVLNLKDHRPNNSSLMDSAGFLSSSKTLSQPIVSLLNQIAVPQTTPISLRTTLSTLSQLFSCSATEGAPRLAGTPDRNVTLPGAMSESKRLSLDSLAASLGGAESKPIGLIGAATTTPTTTATLGSGIDVLGKHILLKTLDLPSNGRISQQTDSNGFHPHTTARPTVASSTVEANGLTATNSSSIVVTSTTTATTTNIPSTLSTAPATNPADNGHSPPSSNGTCGTNQFMFGRRLTHTRRFVCNQCRKNFASLAELNRHTLEAHNSFKCTICSAHFTQRSNLQRHSLKHVGFKPFTCNLCKKEYYRKDHLVRHIEVTHPNHDPKMNITVHLTSSECLDYLDRLHAGKQSPSPNGSADFHEVSGDPEGLCDLETMKIEPSATISGEMTEADDTDELEDQTKPEQEEEDVDEEERDEEVTNN